jgi:succinate dehydrogenase / fumarate reductase, cytochrome b subunit
MHYKVKTGMLAWIMHRITGVALAVYLPMHIWVTSNLQNPEKFDKVMAILNLPLFKLAEIALLGAVIYHTINGARIIMIDWFGKTRQHSQIFWSLMVVAGILFVSGGIAFIMHIINR